MTDAIYPDRFMWAFMGFVFGVGVERGALWLALVALVLMWAVRRKERTG